MRILIVSRKPNKHCVKDLIQLEVSQLPVTAVHVSRLDNGSGHGSGSESNVSSGLPAITAFESHSQNGLRPG